MSLFIDSIRPLINFFQGKIYCKPCYNATTGIGGYGYGSAGGALASYQSYGKGESEVIGGDAQPTAPPSSGSAEQPQKDFQFCVECGSKLPRGTKFCSDCGTKLN